jgi:hypothetical protein
MHLGAQARRRLIRLFLVLRDNYCFLVYLTFLVIILLHVHPLLGNVLVNKFPRREIPGKHSIARLHNNR